MFLLSFAATALAAGTEAQQRPPVAVTPERIIVGPGPVLRAQSLAGAPALPAQGVAVTFRCLVGRSGALDGCMATPPAPQWESFARVHLRGYRINIDDKELKPGEQVPALITVRLAPQDRVALALTGEVDPGRSKIFFSEVPTGRQQAAFYPPVALRADVSATVSLACRVLGDRSLFCPEGRLTREFPEGRVEDRASLEEQFVFAAQQVSSLIRVAPTLRNGSSAIGHQFRMTIGFRPSAD